MFEHGAGCVGFGGIVGVFAGAAGAQGSRALLPFSIFSGPGSIYSPAQIFWGHLLSYAFSLLIVFSIFPGTYSPARFPGVFLHVKSFQIMQGSNIILMKFADFVQIWQ